MYRTHTCGEINESHLNQEVTLIGWANSSRDHGGVIFIDLRDRYEITQIKLDPETTPENLVNIAKEVRNEYIVQVKGKVVMRPEGTFNNDLSTGKIEIVPNEIKIINKSEILPFEISNEHFVREEVRMEHRYLDLRRERMKQNLMARHKITMEMINFLSNEGFLFIETPSLIKNTPEGAREFIVPARNAPGKGFVLPQSPQQLKQILMVSGFDKYFQLCRNFRDEDLRGDRQPEFTQLDAEMSFVHQEDVLDVLERLFVNTCEKLYSNKKLIAKPFDRLSWDESMDTYGIDKPELRTKELKLIDVSDIASKSELKVFGDVVANGGVVKAIVVNKVFTRGEIDKLTALLQEKGAKGLAYIQWDTEGPKSPILKFFSEDLQKELFARIGAKEGTTSFFQATDRLDANEFLGYLRTILIKDLGMTKGKEDELYFEFIVDFPMFEMDKESGALASQHHPFTKPKDEQIPIVLELAKKIEGGNKLDDADIKKLLSLRADCYDLVLNGVELLSGSIRITDPELQKAIFTILGLSPEQTQERFGHMLEAFKYGTPPHGGFGIGFDRFVMILQGEPNIREIIAFPKTQKGEDLMLKTPSEIDPKLLRDLGLKLKD